MEQRRGGGPRTGRLRPRALLAGALAVATVAFGVRGIGPAPAVGEAAEPGVTTRVSVASDGTQRSDPTTGSAAEGEGPGISADGHHVAFVSPTGEGDADGDVPDQVLVRDRIRGATTVVSRTPAGDDGNGPSSGQPALSADGRYVAFQSDASDLVGPERRPRVTDGPDLVKASTNANSSRALVQLTFDEPAWDTCPGTDPCTVTMGASTSRTAMFGPPSFRLSVDAEGGNVVSTPPGIDCPGHCTNDFPAGSTVALSARPDSDTYFVGWAGDCQGTGPCEVNMSADRSVVARFQAIVELTPTTGVVGVVGTTPPAAPVGTSAAALAGASPSTAASSAAQDGPPATLDVDLAGTGKGTVTSDPPGIACGPDCSTSVPAGSAVTLTAKPAQGSRFLGWSGYRLVVAGGPRRDTVVPCFPVSGDGTTVHLVDCEGLNDRAPWRIYVEPGTVADRPAEGVANPLQASLLSSQPQTASSPYLSSASLDTGGTDSAGANADIVFFVFNEPIALLDSGAFAAYLADGTTVGAVDAVPDGCCTVQVAFPDGSLRNAVGASVRAQGVRERVPTGSVRQANLADEVGLVNLAGDTNEQTDVFVADRDADGNGVFDEPGPGAIRVTKVSVGPFGRSADGPSTHPSISADGRYVGFQSSADDLLPPSTSDGPSPLPVPRTVAGGGDSNDVSDVFVHDRDADGDGVFDEGGSAELTTRSSLADDGSEIEGSSSIEPSLSATGRYVAFTSAAFRQLSGPRFDVLVHDRDADGNGVFDEPAPGATGTRLISVGSEQGHSGEPAISGDGRLVAFAVSPGVDAPQVLVRDRDADGNGVFDEPGAGATTAPVSVGPSGAPGNGGSLRPAISADGRYVSFFSEATDLVSPRPGAPAGDIYVRDRLRGRTSVVSVAPAGGPGDGPSDSASSLSSDGSTVAFASVADDLVPDDTNDVRDTFVRDRPPVARIQPDPADFGAVELGDRSGPLVLHLDNVGVAPLGVGAVTLQGPAAGDFSVDAQNCTGAVLPSVPGRDCTISISFAPGALGRRPASLAVAHDPAPATTTVVRLEGVGVPPPYSVNPAQLDFGTVGVGFSSDRTTAVVNLGRGPQALGPLAVTGSGEFSVVSGACPSPLPAGASCTVRVRFTPAGPGARSASLTGTIGSQPFSVDLTGTGATGVLQLAPDPVDFGTLAVGATADRTATVTNAGPGLLRVDGVDLAAPGFSVQGDGCSGGTLGPGATCSVALRLVPAAAGAVQGTLTARATVAGLPAPATAAVGLVGTASAEAAKASISPNPLDFGDQDVGVPATRSFTVTDEGPGPLPVGTLTLGGTSPGDFTVTGDHCSGRTLTVGTSCTVEVAFSPTAAGRRTATATLPGAGTLELIGNGLLYTPVLTLSDSVGTAGSVTLASGTGFRPNSDVRLRWVAADPRPDAPPPLSTPVDVHVDAAGRFGPVPVPVIQKDVLGPRTLDASGHLPGTFATASFLVVAGSARPAGAEVFINRQTTLVNRG